MKKNVFAVAGLFVALLALTGCVSTKVDYAALAEEGTPENSVVYVIPW